MAMLRRTMAFGWKSVVTDDDTLNIANSTYICWFVGKTICCYVFFCLSQRQNAKQRNRSQSRTSVFSHSCHCSFCRMLVFHWHFRNFLFSLCPSFHRTFLPLFHIQLRLEFVCLFFIHSIVLPSILWWLLKHWENGMRTCSNEKKKLKS